MGHDRDPVARADPRRDQARGERVHLIPELGRSDVFPGATAVLAPQRHGIGLLGGPPTDHVGQVRGRRDVRQGWDAVLAHDFSNRCPPESILV